MKNITPLLLFFILLTSCNNNSVNVFSKMKMKYVEFENTANLKGQIIHENLLGVEYITIYDTLMIMITPQNDKLYRVLAINNWQDLGSIVTKGRASNELISAHYPMYFEKNDNIDMFIYEPSIKKMRLLNISESLKNEHAIFDDSDLADVSDFPYLDYIYPLSDGTFFIDHLKGFGAPPFKQQYGIINKTGDLKELAYLDGTKIESQQYPHLLAASNAINETERLYVSAMIYLDQINFLNIDNPKKSFSVTTNDKVQEFSNINMMEQTKWYYSDVTTTNEIVVALYANTNDNLSELHIFDWNGKPLYCVKTDIAIIDLTIDTNKNIVYGLTAEEQLYSFDLSNLVR